MPVEALLPRLAEHLRLTILSSLAGGEFGAVLVADAADRKLVLKALPSEAWGPVFARGASLANGLRARGYPAPEYTGTGTVLGATWSLQTRLLGEIPDVVGEPHMRQLLDLAQSHAGSMSPGTWRQERLERVGERLQIIAANDATRPLALELGAVIERLSDVALLDSSVVHGDFHHRNFLAIGDEVTGVFDWEFASVGDWRYDVVTLAFWASLIPTQIPPGIAAVAVERAREACSADVLAFLTALRTITQLDFDVRVHPERLPEILPGLESAIAPWWRDA